MSRAEAIAERTRSRANEICKAIPPIKPGPQYWLESDAGPNYCRKCVRIARGWEFELGPLLVEPKWYDRDEWMDAFMEGIDGGRDLESDSASSCDICGATLQYILTDYGADEEARYFLEAPLVEIRDEDSYALDRLTLNVWHGMNRKRLLMISAAVGQAYRLFKGAAA